MLSDRLTASRECDAEIARALGWGCVITDPVCDGMWVCWRKEYRSGEWIMLKPYTTSLDAAASLYLDKPTMIPSDPLECCRAALKQRGCDDP